MPDRVEELAAELALVREVTSAELKRVKQELIDFKLDIAKEPELVNKLHYYNKIDEVVARLNFLLT